MFVVVLKDNTTLIEGVNCPNWDKVPAEGIKQVILVVDNKPLILPKCDEYFYSIEAISRLGLNSSVSSKPVITAHIIGGVIGDKAIYIRAESNGAIKIEMRDKKDLAFTPQTYKKG